MNILRLTGVLMAVALAGPTLAAEAQGQPNRPQRPAQFNRGESMLDGVNTYRDLAYVIGGHER